MPLAVDLSTASMRVSFCCTRCCVLSTSAEMPSTFLLTSPTSRCTKDFLAQPRPAIEAASSGTIAVRIRHLLPRSGPEQAVCHEAVAPNLAGAELKRNQEVTGCDSRVYGLQTSTGLLDLHWRPHGSTAHRRDHPRARRGAGDR